MRFRNLRLATQVGYLQAGGSLATYHRRSPAEMGQEEVRKVSASTLAVYIAGLRFVFGVTLGRGRRH